MSIPTKPDFYFVAGWYDSIVEFDTEPEAQQWAADRGDQYDWYKIIDTHNDLVVNNSGEYFK